MKPTFQMNKKLDYNLDGTKKRLKKLEQIIEEYDSHLVDYYDNHYVANKTSTSFEQDMVSEDLEKLADYLLFADNKEQRQLAEKNQEENTILTRSQIERNTRKETLTDDLSCFEQNTERHSKHSFYTEEKRFKNKMNINEEKPKKRKAKVQKNDRKSITQADLEKFPLLNETNSLIEKLDKEIKSGIDVYGNLLNEDQLRKRKWLTIELKKDQVAYKDAMSKHVNVKNVIRQSLNNKLDVNFSDHEVIEFLFHEYSHLKQHCAEDINSDLKHILMDFELLVDATPFSDILKEIFILKVDGLSRDEIIFLLEKKHKIKFGKQHISTLIRKTIPKKMIEAYRKQLEDWFYLEIAKGKYKICTRCGETKLATDNYFNKDKKGYLGYKSICKNCHSTK
jgi:hypothetical protein